MATVVAEAHLQRTRARHDRIFYSSIAMVLALTVLVGFGPTYYTKLSGSAPLTTFSGAPITRLVHAHGLLFTAWVLLFVVQTSLIAQRRVAIHRRMGIAGDVLAGSMVVAGTLAALNMAARGVAPPGIHPLSFALIPIGDMLLFAGFVATALRMRANREAHKRLMLLAYVSIIGAAVARLPGMFPLGPLAFFGLAFVFILIGIIYDRVSRNRVHPAYIWGGAVLVVSVPLRLVVSGTDAWKSLAQVLVNLVA